MLKVFNTSSLSQKQRFWNAVLFGSLASIALTIAYIFVFNIMLEIGFLFAVAYIAIGHAIGYVVQYTGHGVQTKFSILAAVFCLLIIIFGDLFTLVPGLLSHLDYLGIAIIELIKSYFSSIFDIIGLVFRIWGIYYAWISARVV